MAVGAGAMLVTATIDYRRYREVAPFVYGGILLAAAPRRHRPRQREEGHAGVVPDGPVPAAALGAGEDRGDRDARVRDRQLRQRPRPRAGSSRSSAPSAYRWASSCCSPTSAPRSSSSPSAWACSSSAGPEVGTSSCSPSSASPAWCSSSTPGCSRRTSSAGCRRSSTRTTRTARRGTRPTTPTRPSIAIGSGGFLGKGPFNGHPDPSRHRARAAHRLHLHRGGGGARLRGLGHPARPAGGDRLADLADGPDGPRPAGHADLRRRPVDVRVPGVRERRDDDGDHAGHGHPPARS